MVVLNERADLRADRGTIKAHHKELAHLPATWPVSISPSLPCSGCQVSQYGNSLNRPRGPLGFHRPSSVEMGEARTGGGQGLGWGCMTPE